MTEKNEGRASGVFSLAVGAILLALCLAFPFLKSLSANPGMIFQAWLACVGVAMAYWGGVRARYGKEGTEEVKWAVGQNTIGFAFGAIAATIALYAVLFPSGSS